MTQHWRGTATYQGCEVPDEFMNRWRGAQHVARASPYMEVRVRRGEFTRSYGTWDGSLGGQFGQILGRHIEQQWWADWTGEEWNGLKGIYQVDLDQSFDKNGATVATVEVDNVRWIEALSTLGLQFHQVERGVYWPWRGYRPPSRPAGSRWGGNEFFNELPNAQIDVWQGYGPDVKVRTFTGLIDSFTESVRPDRISLTCRDFSGPLTDTPLFDDAKDPIIPNDHLLFVPTGDPLIAEWEEKAREFWILDPQVRKQVLTLPGWNEIPFYVIVDDVTDVVKCLLRWAGFKQAEIEKAGVKLGTPLSVDKSKSYIDIINAIKQQLGYVFFMAEPTDDDDSIGVPIFRRPSALIPSRSQPIAVSDQDLVTDFKPVHDNKDDRDTIDVYGQMVTLSNSAGSYEVRTPYARYGPPFAKTMAGVRKPLVYYNIGDQGILGFLNDQQCMVAAVLIAYQIGLGRDTATMQVPGNPAFGLDSFAYVEDIGTGVASRVYITNRKSVMKLGGDGSSNLGSGAGSNELLWATELGGALVDNPEMDRIVRAYNDALDAAANDPPTINGVLEYHGAAGFHDGQPIW